MEKQKFYMPASLLIKILVCLAVIAAFWVAPPVAPLDRRRYAGHRYLHRSYLMLSIVDTVWPAMLAIVLLGQSGVCTVNEAIAGSIGNWIIYFVLMSFIMTHALNESGFTDRLVAKFMSIKLVSKSPWIFTISLGVLGMLLGCFMDQVPATAFDAGVCLPHLQRAGLHQSGCLSPCGQHPHSVRRQHRRSHDPRSPTPWPFWASAFMRGPQGRA